MAYTIALTDEEYAALSAAAAERRQPIEALVHEALAERYATSAADAQAAACDPLVAHMLRTGHIRQAPTGTPDTPGVRAERRRLAARVGPGKLASEMAQASR